MFENLFSLEGRVALVTGGSRGIGKMIAAGFLAQGAKVYISSRKADQCNAAAEELSQGNGRCISLPMDLSTVDGCKALTEELKSREDHLDILVNNAGAAWGADFEELPDHGWDKVMDLNLKSPFFLTPWETYSYHASKSGLIFLTRRIAARLINDGIVVTGIAPGPFPSEMNKTARDEADDVAKKTPAGRVGNDEDMAGAAIYLASRAGDYVVGDTIAVDGGHAYAQLA